MALLDIVLIVLSAVYLSMELRFEMYIPSQGTCTRCTPPLPMVVVVYMACYVLSAAFIRSCGAMRACAMWRGCACSARLPAA